MKLGLGTVQFGLDYGITNAAGQTPASEVGAILTHAAAHGVDTLDTAALYGSSEAVLGAALPRPHGFRIVTKTLALDPALPPAAAVDALVAGVERSLDRLGEDRLAGLLVHRVDDLLGPQGDWLFAALAGLRADGRVEKIGTSLYIPEEAAALLQRYPLDLVQLPLNPLDQRHLAGGSLAALAAAGVEVHVRSAFLQGLLLAPERPLPTGLAALAPALAAWRRLAAELGLSLLEACFAFLKGIPAVGTAVCGAATLAEWQEIVAAWEAAPALPQETFKNLAVADDKLIDPRHWPKP